MMNPNRYSDLSAGGEALSQALSAYKDREKVVVLGIARAGTPVALKVAKALNLPVDLILIRRLLIGDGPGANLGAVNVAGETILDDGIVISSSPSTPQEIFLAEALAEFRRREELCRRGRKPIDLSDQTLIAVDCGIRTGSTMKAAGRALRKTKAKSIIGAVPVSSREGYAAVAPLFDELICLQQPEQFVNAGFWYADFGRPRDEEVGDLF